MSLVNINIAHQSAKARCVELRSDNRHRRRPPGSKRRGAEKTHYVSRVVRGPQRVSSALLSFQLGQMGQIDVSARKDANLVLDACENPEGECGGGLQGAPISGHASSNSPARS